MSEQEWSIVLSYVTGQPPTEDELERLANEFDTEDATVSARPDRRGFDIYFWVEGPFERVAAKQLPRVLDRAGRLIAAAGIDAAPDGVRIRSAAQVDAELAQPTIPDLLAAADVAELIGTSRQRVHQLARENPRFPAPLVEPATGPLWDRRAIDTFVRGWNRRPGRPAKRAS
jgi:hypothetical protein